MHIWRVILGEAIRLPWRQLAKHLPLFLRVLNTTKWKLSKKSLGEVATFQDWMAMRMICIPAEGNRKREPNE